MDNPQTEYEVTSSLSPPHNPEEDISLLDLLIVLASRKRFILIVTLGFAVSGALISLVLPKRYTATVTILPPQQNTSIGAAMVSQLGNVGSMAATMAGGSLSLKNPNDMYVAMLTSRTVEDAMVQRFDLMHEYGKAYPSDARKAFENHLNVDGSTKDGLIHISFENKNPQRAAQIANGFVEEFRTLSRHLAITEASQRRLFFEEQLEQAKDNLANAEEALKRTEQSTGLIQLDSQARALIESASTLRAQIAAKEVQIQSMRTFATGENSGMIQAEQELEGLRSQLSKLAGSDETSAGLLVPKGMVPQAGLEYIRKLRDVKYHETIFDILARQFEIAKLDEAKQGSVIQVVDSAIPPDKRSFPKRGFIMMGATIAGFFIAIFLAFMHAGIERLKGKSEVNQKLAVLGEALHAKKVSNS